jgi:hypothetical protein
MKLWTRGVGCGRFLRLGSALVAGALSGAAVCAAEPEPTLPFTIKITEGKIDPVPDYMGPKNPLDMDFPYCPVAIEGEYWIIYKNGYKAPVVRFKGTNIEDGVRQPDGAAETPKGAYILGGMWYDAAGKTLYAPLHYEVDHYAGCVRREAHLATSADKGVTWKYAGPLLTNPGDDGVKPRQPATEYSGLYWDGGDGDHILFVDERGGYVYLFTNYYCWPKNGSPATPILRHRVARCALADKMEPGKWRKFYNGAWDEPGVGGKASYVNGYNVIYNAYLKKYVSINGLGGLSVCDDLSKQAWSASYYVGPCWFERGLYGTWATDEAKRDTATAGQTMYVYNFWEWAQPRLFKVEFGAGETGAKLGFTSPTTLLIHMDDLRGADPGQCHGFTPLFESPDGIDARRTRRVGCLAGEVKYGGKWGDVKEELYYEGRAKSADEAGAEASFTFKGRDIYWRAAKGPSGGKAEVYLDGALQGTVDCWASRRNPFQFAFVKQGLSDGEHTIKVVVKGEHGPLSGGSAIEHQLFEYSAETYRASDGFSSLRGKNGWTNQERHGASFTDMTFKEPVWKGGDGCEVGYFQMTAGGGDVVRKWVAPHDGMVRIEGAPALDGANARGLDATVFKNGEKIWAARLSTAGTAAAAHDLKAAVHSGDALMFVLQKDAATAVPGPGLEVVNGAGAVELNGSGGKAMKIGGKEYKRGLHFRAAGKVMVKLPGAAERIAAEIGVDGDRPAEAKGTAEVSIRAGGRIVFKSDAAHLRPNEPSFGTDLHGVSELVIEAGEGIDLADARVYLLDGQEVWLGDLAVRGATGESTRVVWDPGVTYEK